MATINDIAAKLGISKSTVSKGLNNIVLGFKQMAEPDGWTVDIIPITIDFQKLTPYDIFMMQSGYQASFILGMSLLDPWMKELRTSSVPTVLYDNYIKNNPNIASIGCDSQEGFELAVKHLIELGHKIIGLISGPLDSYMISRIHQRVDEIWLGYK